MKIKVTVQQGKKCTRCGEIKPLGLFPLDKTKPDGHRPQCRACHNESKQRKRIFVKYAKRGTDSPMMSNEFFEKCYKDRELKDYIKTLAGQRSRGNCGLEADMEQAAWVRIAFLRSGASIERMKDAAYKAIEAERWKHWARWYHEGLTFDELLSHEEWAMWASGCLD